MVYIDIRKPNANSFNITEEEWKQIKTSKENLSGWERILDRTFSALGHDTPKWKDSHTCDGDNVYKDENSSLLKFKVSFEPYRKAINYAIFSPTEYNCQILEKIVKPARPVFDTWWSKIETSRLIENNRGLIRSYIKSRKPNEITLVGLLTDGGQGLATGDNGRFVGYKSNSRFAKRCKEIRVEKLWQAIQKEPSIVDKYLILTNCKEKVDVKNALDSISEIEIWDLFDSIKANFEIRIFGKGFLYRVIPESLVFDVSKITEIQKQEGIIGDKYFVPYDKGDKEGNRWFSNTEYLIDWSKTAISDIKSRSHMKGSGKSLWQNSQFYFKKGLCWNESLNPNSSYIECRLKNETVNDVSSMSIYDQSGFGDFYLVSLINSYTIFKVVREFLNNTVKIQMNDIRKLPIKIPSEKELKAFNQKFDECLAIKKEYFSGEIDRAEMNAKLRPIEAEIDEMVNKIYGIAAKEDIELEDLGEDALVTSEMEEDEE